MIVDNADELNLFYNSTNNSTSLLLSKYLPFNTRGAILFTTRDHRAATKYAPKQVISVEEMDDKESRELFSHSLQNKQLLKDNAGVIKLLELLVNLPLAIVQAAAYLNENTTTIAQYLQIYEESSDGFIQLLSEDFEDEGRYPEIKNPIITTWLISFNQIRDRDSLAADYLAFISCIKEESIPLILLPEAPLFDKTKALGTLKGFKFVNEQLGGVLISMHRLVHLAIRNWLKVEGEWTLWNEKTLDRMEAVFPWPEHENRTFWTTLLPHAQYVIISTKDFNVQDRPRRNLLGKLGRCFWMTGNDKDSQEMYQQELELNEEVLGKENPLTLTSMNNLALALSNQGKYDEAEPKCRQTLALSEKVLGKEHPNTLSEHEQPRFAVGEPGEVRRGRADISPDTGPEGEGAREGTPQHAHEHEQPRWAVDETGKVRRGRADISPDTGPEGECARKGTPQHAHEHEQPRWAVRQPGKVRRGRADISPDTGPEGEGAREGTPQHAHEHEQPRWAVDETGKVRRGRADISPDTGPEGEGAREETPQHAYEHEQPGFAVEDSGKVRRSREVMQKLR